MRKCKPEIQIRKRNQTYSYSFDVGTYPGGNRKVLEQGGFRTKKEALEVGMSMRDHWLSGNYTVSDSRLCIREAEEGEFILTPNTTLKEFFVWWKTLGHRQQHPVAPLWAYADELTKIYGNEKLSMIATKIIANLIAKDFLEKESGPISTDPLTHFLEKITR